VNTGLYLTNQLDKNFGLDFNGKDAIDLESNFSNFSTSSDVLNGDIELPNFIKMLQILFLI
jgi:hypothetical protein